MKRVRWGLAGVILLLGVVGCILATRQLPAGEGLDVFAKNKLAGEVPRQVFQVISEDMRHTRMLAWQGEMPDFQGKIEFRPVGGGTPVIVAAERCELPAFQGEQTRLYTVKLQGLAAGTAYQYRVFIGEQASSWYSFHTEPEEQKPYTALIFGDSQCLDYSVWAATAQKAWQDNPQAAFFINMGDLVDNGQDYRQWRAWLDGAEKLLTSMPVAPVMGNHEDYSLQWKEALPVLYLALFQVPANGPARLKGHAYSFDYGAAHFVVLDTQLQELQSWYPELFADQQKWLRQDLAQSKCKWKIVLMHRGIWTLFTEENWLNEEGEAFAPIFAEGGVDLVFTAHVHAYARTGPQRGRSDHSQGTVYITTGRSGDKVWTGSPSKPVDIFFHNPIDQPNYLTLTVSEEALQVQAFQQDGSLLDQAVIYK